MGVLGVDQVALRSPDAAVLRDFSLRLTGGEQLDAPRDAVRLGSTLLAFFAPERGSAGDRDPDEIAFDVEAQGFGDVLASAERHARTTRPPVEQTPWSRGFLVHDSGRRRRLECVDDGQESSWQE